MTIRTEVRRLEHDVGQLLETHDRGRSLAEFSRYTDDPLGFIRQELGWEPWEAQVEVAEAVLEHPLVATRSANGIGKDALAARLALWWAIARGGLAIITGPTLRQVRTICFGEIRRAWGGTNLPGELFEQELRVDRTTGAGIIGLTSTESGKLTGLHGAKVLGIVTEAQAVEPHVFEGLLACAVGDADRLLALLNPLEPSGEAYRISQPGSGWHSIAIPASRHPNVIEGRSVIPGGVTRAFVERIAKQYGRDSGVYAARVEGEFPDQGSEGLFQRSWLEDADQAFRDGRFAAEAARAEPLVGVDVARFGVDRCAMAVRRGPVLSELKIWGQADTIETARRIGEEVGGLLPAWNATPGFPGAKGTSATGAIVVDAFGVGSGVIDQLRELGYNVREFYGWNPPVRERGRFVNARVASYWTLRDLLEAREVAIEWNDELVEELLATRYRPTGNGLIQLEPKDDIKARLGRSPDLADAVTMAFYASTAPRWRTVRARW